MSPISRSKQARLLIVLMASLALTACSQPPNPSASDSAAASVPAAASDGAASDSASSDSATTAADGKITLTNCGQELTYPGQVSKIVATSNSANVGTLLRIGAADKMVAASLRQGNDPVLSALYGKGIESVPRMDNPISMEAIVASQPDLLIGSYSGLFSGSSGVTVETANEHGIPTYVISDSCRQDPAAGSASKLGTMDPWDAVRTDVKNYGTLTGKTKEADEALKELEDGLDALEKAPKPDKKPTILLFDSGTDELYTSGKNGPPQGIIDAAGGVNAFADQDTTWFKASWEAVAQTKPDVIVVLDYRKGDDQEIPNKLETIRTQPALKDLPVVKENRIIVLPLVLFTSGFPNLEAAAQVRKGLEDLDLAPKSDVETKMPTDLGYGVIKS